jgi:hypothetical protein
MLVSLLRFRNDLFTHRGSDLIEGSRYRVEPKIDSNSGMTMVRHVETKASFYELGAD